MCEVVAMVNRRDSHRAWTGGGGGVVGGCLRRDCSQDDTTMQAVPLLPVEQMGREDSRNRVSSHRGKVGGEERERSKPDSVFLQERKGKVKIPVSEEGNELVVPFAWFGFYHVIALSSLTRYVRHLTQQPADVGGPAGVIPFGRYKRAWKADDAILPASTSPVTLSSANSALRQPHT